MMIAVFICPKTSIDGEFHIEKKDYLPYSPLELKSIV